MGGDSNNQLWHRRRRVGLSVETMGLNCGLASWTTRLFCVFILFQSVSVLFFGKSGWESRLSIAPTQSAAVDAPMTRDKRSLLTAAATTSTVPPEKTVPKVIPALAISQPPLPPVTPPPNTIVPPAQMPIVAESMSQDEEAILAAKREGAHAGVLLEYTFQIGLCLMAFFVNELGGRHIQRTLLLFQILTFGAAAYGSLEWLVPVGYDDTKAKAETMMLGGMLFLMFILLCCDCCAGADGEKT